MTYQDRSQFQSAFSQSTAQTADFNGFTQDVRFIPSVGPADAGPYSLSANRILASSEILLPNKIDVPPFFPAIDLDGTPFAYILVERDSNMEVTVAFDAPALAFGGDFNRVDGAPGESLDLVLTFEGGGTQTLQAPDPDSFFGFVSNSQKVTSIVFRGRTANGTEGGTGFGLDNTQVGYDLNAIPEPSTVGLLILLTAGVCARRPWAGAKTL